MFQSLKNPHKFGPIFPLYSTSYCLLGSLSNPFPILSYEKIIQKQIITARKENHLQCAQVDPLAVPVRAR